MVSRYPDGASFLQPEAFLEKLATRISHQQYDTWFRNSRFDFVPPNRIVISVQSRFHQKWLETHYSDSILSTVRDLCHLDPILDFRVEGDAASGDRPLHSNLEQLEHELLPRSRLPRSGPERPISQPRRTRSSTSPTICSPINPNFTFDSFLLGPANRIARAASLAVSESTVSMYNPLYIYGDPGLGKSHLLQAAYQKLDEDSERVAVYLTSDDFLELCRTASRNRKGQSLPKLFDDFDVLIVDDLQQLSRSARFCEVFSEVLGHFLDEDHRVILSAACSPADLPADFPDRLRSRLKTGLVVKLETPCFDFRVRLLKSKAERLGQELSDELAEGLARGFGGNPRELEGLVLKLVHLGQSSLSSAELLERLPELGSILGLGSSTAVGSKSIELLDILSAVCSYFSKTRHDLVSSSREKSLVRARQIAMYLSRDLTHHTLEDIGVFYGGRDHATVIHAVNKINRLRDDDQILLRDLDNLRRNLGR